MMNSKVTVETEQDHDDNHFEFISKFRGKSSNIKLSNKQIDKASEGINDFAFEENLDRRLDDDDEPDEGIGSANLYGDNVSRHVRQISCLMNDHEDENKGTEKPEYENNQDKVTEKVHNFSPSDEFHEIKLDERTNNKYKFNSRNIDDIERQDQMYYKENSTTQYPPGRSGDISFNKEYRNDESNLEENDQSKNMFVNQDIFAKHDEKVAKSINIDVLDELDFDKKDKTEDYIPIEVNRKY